MGEEKSILEFLFWEAKKDSNQSYDITPIAGTGALALARKLVNEGLIRDEVRSSGASVYCAISIVGVKLLDGPFVDRKIMEVLRQTGKAETIWNVVTLLKEKPEAFQFCFDLSIEMQNRDLVKLLYALYPTKVMIETTLEGARVANE